MESVMQQIEMVFKDTSYMILFPIALVVGFIIAKGNRKSVVVPAIIITIAVINPWFYKVWDKTIGGNFYWRGLWIVPIILVCAMVPSVVVDHIKRDVMKTIVLGISLLVFSVCGVFIYDNHTFAGDTNADKLPDDVVEVAEYLLSVDKDPYIVADANISTYIRQYSGQIKAMYTRDVVFGEPTALARRVYAELSNDEGNLDLIAQEMLNNDYEYLITRNEDDSRNQKLESAGFKLIHQANEYGVYEVAGKRTEARTYNERHQVTSITMLDDDGNPCNNEQGYATIEYGYDSLGRQNYEFHKDQDGNGIEDESGKAGVLREYNTESKIIKETYLASSGMPIASGYAVHKFNYNIKNQLVIEAYYDIHGVPADGGSGYARIEYTYSSDGKLAYKRYYDVDGNLIDRGSGYLHDYLQSLKGRDAVIFISIRDDGTSSLTETIQEDLNELGIQTRLIGQYAQSFYAIITPEEVVENIGSEALSFSGTYEGVQYTIESAGFSSGNYSSIVIDGIEYSKNARGMNIVLVDLKSKTIIDNFAIDTHMLDMGVTR